ncbi:hypothetical protein Trydic_g14017 [Trypoxylus dichotomus]
MQFKAYRIPLERKPTSLLSQTMSSKTVCALVLVLIFNTCQQWITCTKLPPTCDSLVYCQGELLHTIQTARLYDDSKTFVDKSMLNDVETTLSSFYKLMNDTDGDPSKQQLQAYVDENFISENELDVWIPDDFVEEPSFISRIEDADVQKFAKNIVSIWKDLGRKTKKEVLENPDQHSLIAVPNGFIVPGGRFQEYYYWDSYWIIDGLLVSGMAKTAQGMINNFLSLVDRYGHVPNGGRVYYLRRSQPPLLSHMAMLYFETTNDVTWLKNSIDLLEKEVEFWLKNRMVKIRVRCKDYNVAYYHAVSDGPRPESYYEDFITASYYKTREEKAQMYIELKSGAESGWDFTSRWIFDKHGGANANLTFTRTSRVAPIDLNAYLYGAFVNMADFYGHLKNEKKQVYWNQQALTLNSTINELFWNESDGIWHDFDIDLLKQRTFFTAANLAPLWTKAYNVEKHHTTNLIQKVVSYLKEEGVTHFLGGIPTTIGFTGEQWDYPNAWPCLQSVVIEGLENSGVLMGQQWAREFAERWIRSNMIGYEKSGHMYEKYDAEIPGQYGGGGEYNVQTGFGWTNGVVLKLIQKYYST